MWQGLLFLKNDSAKVQLHFVTGNKELVGGALNPAGDIVRISQRMRLGHQQLDGIEKKMAVRTHHTLARCRCLWRHGDICILHTLPIM